MLNPAQKIDLKSVLLLVDGDKIKVGTPTVAGANVGATVVEHIQGR